MTYKNLIKTAYTTIHDVLYYGVTMVNKTELKKKENPEINIPENSRRDINFWVFFFKVEYF